MKPGITVVIPTIAPRRERLQTALASVMNQTRSPDQVVVTLDNAKVGAPENRQAGLDSVTTEWTAFLDDDDELYPEHLAILCHGAAESGADLVYPWFDVHGGTDPFPMFENQPWSNHEPHQIPITFMVKTELAHRVGGFTDFVDDNRADKYGNRAGEDYHFILKLVEARARIYHVPRRTWRWNHWHGNTSGLPSRW